MGTPQDPRARHRQKARRAKKNAAYEAKRAATDTPPQKPGTVAKSGR